MLQAKVLVSGTETTGFILINYLSNSNKNSWFRARHFTALIALPLLTACPIDSTEVDDSSLIADFLVQNNNGESSAVVTFSSRNLSGNNEVNLTRQESIFYRHEGQEDDLNERDDGVYAVNLPAEASGLYSFTIVRMTEEEFNETDRPPFFREIDDNHVFLPETFQELQAEAVQVGSSLNISWRIDDTLQTINGFTTPAAVDSFNAIASCQNNDGPFDVAITDGQLTQQSDRLMLDIAVTEHLSQVLGMPIDSVATSLCDFDIQLNRNVAGTTDTRLDRRSVATGQVLQNLTIQWTSQ